MPFDPVLAKSIFLHAADMSSAAERDTYVAEACQGNPELRARVDVGVRVIQLQIRLAERIQELQEALAHVNQLKGIIPICAQCKRIRDDQNYWQRVEKYIAKNIDARFTHGLCPDCAAAVQIEVDRMQGRGASSRHGGSPDESEANR